MEAYFDRHLNDLDIFFMLLQTHFGTKLTERKSLIIFDEVQMFPQARAAIKYLVADGRYDYEEYKERIGESYIIHPRNLIIKDGIVCIPPYMVICL